VTRLVALLVLLCAGTGAWATMAERAVRSKAGGVDLVTYRTDVKDVINIVGAFPAGDAFATGNAAIPTLTGMMLDRGTTALDKFAIAQQLENVGAEISFSVGVQSVQVRARCLRKDLGLVIRLVAAELRTPAFVPAEFLKAKQQMIGGLEQSLQSTDVRAQQAFQRAIFPEGHPNRPHSVEEFLSAAKSANLEDVRRFHAKFYGPAHLTLVIVGDVDSTQAQRDVASAFSGWSGGQDYLRPATPALSTGPREITVPLADKPSVTTLLGQPSGLRYRDPDSLALRVGTDVLGQGFTGRLMRTVRDKQGLTYNVSAGMGEDSIADGSWDVSASFAPALLEKGLASSREVLNEWWNGGITDSELQDRKRGEIGGYFVGLSTTGSLAGTILVTLQRGYDVDWLDRYPEAVNALTRDQVNAAIKAHLNPGTMILVKAGSVPAAPVTPPVAKP
jgi:zinc protease